MNDLPWSRWEMVSSLILSQFLKSIYRTSWWLVCGSMFSSSDPRVSATDCYGCFIFLWPVLTAMHITETAFTHSEHLYTMETVWKVNQPTGILWIKKECVSINLYLSVSASPAADRNQHYGVLQDREGSGPGGVDLCHTLKAGGDQGEDRHRWRFLKGQVAILGWKGWLSYHCFWII